MPSTISSRMSRLWRLRPSKMHYEIMLWLMMYFTIISFDPDPILDTLCALAVFVGVMGCWASVRLAWRLLKWRRRVDTDDRPASSP